jgi:hypothetical protein
MRIRCPQRLGTPWQRLLGRRNGHGLGEGEHRIFSNWDGCRLGATFPEYQNRTCVYMVSLPCAATGSRCFQR